MGEVTDMLSREGDSIAVLEFSVFSRSSFWWWWWWWWWERRRYQKEDARIVRISAFR